MTVDGIVDREAAEAYLRAVARQDDDDIDLAEAALHLAALDRPRVALDRYRAHIAALVDRLMACDDDVAGDRAAAIARLLYDEEGYDGDRLTYDDLQNANLIRVIDRRRGLPVTLGLLYIHIARRRGWTVTGINFPGHFLLRLDGAGERVLVDPFDRGGVRDAADLRQLLRAVGGPEAELAPVHYAPAGNREILVRLQANIKLRLVQSGAFERAGRVAERMLWLAPEDAHLWQDYGLIQAHLGRADMAEAALETAIDRAADDDTRHNAARLLQELRRRAH